MGAAEGLHQMQSPLYPEYEIQVKPGVLTKLEKMLMAGDIEECHQTLDDEISKYAHPELCVSRALIIALGEGHSSIAEVLLERSTPEGELMAYEMWGITPLHIAVAQNNESMVELLLMSNASTGRRVHGRVTELLDCVGQTNGPVFHSLYYQNRLHQIPTPLGIAVYKGYRSVVDILIRRNVINAYLLHALVWHKRDTWLAELLPNYLKNVNQPDDTGSTPLHIAVMVKSVPCIEMLLSAHADGTLLNLDGLSPLHMAIEKQLDIGIFERLVESIDDVNMGNMSRSLLTLALCQDSPVREFVIALLNRGASIEGIPSRDWWKTFRPPEENPGDFHHIHISRNMQQTYYIQLCTNISLEFGSPRHRCEAHKKINMLLFSNNGPGLDPALRRAWNCRVSNQGLWRPTDVLPSLTHLARLPPDQFYITLAISVGCPKWLEFETFATARYTSWRYPCIGWVLTKADDKRRETLLQEENVTTKDDKLGDFSLRVVTYFSTLDCGWIPESPGELWIYFVKELNRDWDMVFEKSLQYLNSMRIKVLQEEGGNKKIIKELLRASLECSHFVEALKLQVDRIMSQIEIYQTHDYLRESLHDDSALEKISTSTKQLEKDVKKKISELSQLTQDLITLEFNLVSIHEAQLSTSMSVSMKRLSWITFIYLPLTFAASVFGANINVLADNPGWWWMVIVAGALMLMTFSGWVLFKYTELEKHLETTGDSICRRINNRLGGRNSTDREKAIKDELD